MTARLLQTCYEIEKRLTLLNRHTRLRVRNWLQRLRRVTHNSTWQRCRNEHAALLLLQLQQGRLEPPFDKEPPSGPINNLPLHLKVLLAASRRPKPPPPVPRFIESPQPAPPARCASQQTMYVCGNASMCFVAALVCTCKRSNEDNAQSAIASCAASMPQAGSPQHAGPLLRARAPAIQSVASALPFTSCQQRAGRLARLR